MAIILVLLPILIILAIVFISLIKSPLKLGILFSSVHLCVVVILAILVFKYNLLYRESSAPFAPLYLVDLPSTLIIPLIRKFVHSAADYTWTYQFCIPVTVFSILGSFQYFLIGYIIGWIKKKKKQIS